MEHSDKSVQRALITIIVAIIIFWCLRRRQQHRPSDEQRSTTTVKMPVEGEVSPDEELNGDGSLHSVGEKF